MDAEIKERVDYAEGLLHNDFDKFFTYMVYLHEHEHEGDLDAFEFMKTALLNRALDRICGSDVDKRKRMKAVLWRRNMEIKRSNNPLATSIVLFYDDVDKFKAQALAPLVVIKDKLKEIIK